MSSTPADDVPCPKCGELMEYGEQPTIQAGEIGHCVIWTCLNEKCSENGGAGEAGGLLNVPSEKFAKLVELRQRLRNQRHG